VIEHDIAPRALAAPMHVHENEDEYSFVISGRVGVRIGDEAREAGPGEMVAKPRRIPHAFWNPGDEEARLFELISPAGFERYFEEVAPLLPPNVPEPDLDRLAATQGRYRMTMDPSSIDPLVREHGLNAG
jgi:hypothetical protein